MTIRHRRSANYLRENADLSECYCCGASPDQIHHTSYQPERTVPVCSSCHGKIHGSSSQFSELEPDQPRPEHYESRRRAEVRRRDGPLKGVCDECGGKFPSAELYSLDISWETVRRRLGRYTLEEMPTDFRCFECMGTTQQIRRGGDDE